jgi:hypothetical protein
MTIPPQSPNPPADPAPSTSRRRSRSRSGADPPTNSVVEQAAREPDLEHLWRAFELAQRHYETDLQLFSVRMNLFLLIQSALIALVGSAAKIDKVDRGAVAAFGLALAIGWQLVASSSYFWIKTWRSQWRELGKCLRDRAHVDVSSWLFGRDERYGAHEKTYGKEQRFWSHYESFSWRVRPTMVICFLPTLFIFGWIVLLIIVIA